jgi:DNA-binding beta-propeller fold protein YncE
MIRPALLLLCISSSCLADQLVLVAGGSVTGLPTQAQDAKLLEPFGTEFDKEGNAWIIEMVSGNRLLKLDGSGQISHVAGQLKPGFSGDGGPALDAQFHGPHNLAVLPDGRVLIGDTWNGCVRVVDPSSGKVNLLPGYGVPPDKAKGNGPYCIALNPAGTVLYIADLRQVWALDLATSTKRLVAGNGKKGRPTDGEVAAEAPLVDPRAVAVDSQGRVYILERGGNALRVVEQDGKIRTVVNASGKQGGTGDGGPALAATMSGPKHLCVDKDDTVILADAESHLVRRYLPKDGSIHRIAGTGKKGSAGLDGPPEKAELARPHGVSIHPTTGELYITDSYNNRVLKVAKE